MTITVTVTTGDTVAEVQRMDTSTNPPTAVLGLERVEPHSQSVFYLHGTLALAMREQPKP